jgi:ring-1,2-phenylacetyl-CoA epoxidase subunit PaaD
MQVEAKPDLADVWRWLAEVPDPEIPVISVVDLGIVRDVAWDVDTLVVAVTPTYSGCPATSVINMDIEAALHAHGISKIRLERRLSPPWTTAWVSDEARDRLRQYGIAPPIEGTAADGRLGRRIARLREATNMAVPCPRCGSPHTQKVSQFGSTPCKASYRCAACLEPFDYFKCI